jgi:microsomal dipeptidase-like Zn-dependent dipeptidase
MLSQIDLYLIIE